MKSHLFKQTFYGLVLLLLSTQLHAEQWYHVEFVVYENLTTITDEQWPIDTSPTQEVLTPEQLTNEAEKTASVNPEEVHDLQSVVNNLNRSNKYRVHYYQVWQQHILGKRSAEDTEIEAQDGEVTGTIKLYKSTYLHASLDLWLKQNKAVINSWSDAMPEGAIESVVRNPHLVETRRIRSKKLYFFDHPKLGALLQLTPIKTPEDIEIKNESFGLPTEAAPTVTQ